MTRYIAVLILVLASAQARGSLIVYGTSSDYAPVPGASLSDVRMSVDMTVSSGVATMTFTNVSVSPETTAVFKSIALDTFEDDTQTAILWNPQILTQTSSVRYSVGSGVLPGFNDILEDDFGMITLDAESPAPKYGLGPGEILQVSFNTSLAAGSIIDDYLAAFGDGSDGAEHTLGFHAISSAIVRGQSLSGMNSEVPEPATMLLMAAGCGIMVLRRPGRAAAM